MSLKIIKYSVGIVLVTFLLVIIILYNYQFLFQFSKYQTVSPTIFFYSRLLIWAALIFAVFYSKFVENDPLSLWVEKKYSPKFYISKVLLIYLLYVVGTLLIGIPLRIYFNDGRSDLLTSFKNIFEHNYFLLIFTCFTAAIVEELVMRAYIQTRLEKIYKNNWAPIVISSLLFGILHSTYGTMSQILVPMYIGALFSFFYFKYRNIKLLIILHFLIDFISINLLIFLHKH